MATPSIIGNYAIDRELGRGGMGVVYRATHRVLGKPAAIKLLLADDAGDRVERFFNEARAATAIDHPGIVKVLDVGVAEDGRAYIAMELLEGESLATRLRRGPLEVASAVDIARQIADALSAAHAVDIIHRDLKPDNVFVVGGTRIKVLDFGIAKLAPSSAGNVRTETGAVVGTPIFMSPEQCDGAREIDARADLYSLGCVLFAMVTGRPPFEGEGTGALIGMHLHVAPPPLRSLRPAASPALEAVVARLLAKSPSDRFASAREVAEALADPAMIELVPQVADDRAHSEPVSPTAPTVSTDLAPRPQQAPEPPAAPVTRPSRSPSRIITVAGTVAVAIAGTVVVMRGSHNVVSVFDHAGVRSDPPSDDGSSSSDPSSDDGSPSALDPRAGMIAADYDPSQLDLLGYIPRARAHARAIMADAEFVDYVMSTGVNAAGKVDVRNGGSVLYRFRSEQASASPDRRCYVMVIAWETHVTASVGHPVAACDRPYFRPRCTIPQIWERARHAIGTRTSVNIQVFRGRWVVTDEKNHSSVFEDDCR